MDTFSSFTFSSSSNLVRASSYFEIMSDALPTYEINRSKTSLYRYVVFTLVFVWQSSDPCLPTQHTYSQIV